MTEPNSAIAGHDQRKVSPLLVLWIGLAFISIQFDMNSSKYFSRMSMAEEVVLSDSFQGNVARQSAFLLLGGGGCYAMFCLKPHHTHRMGPLLLLIIGLFAWCILSILWSVDVGLSVRRVFGLACCISAAFGVSRIIRYSEFSRATIAICLCSVGLGVIAELYHGRFAPWSGDYRFAGTLHPNAQAMTCCVGVLAAVSLWVRYRQSQWWLTVVIGILVLGIVFSKSRTSVFALMVSGLAQWWFRAKLHNRIMITNGTIWAVSLVGIIMMTTGVGASANGIFDVVFKFGREDQSSVQTLSGRLPLWTELVAFAWGRLGFGYGYGAFWNPERCVIISGIVSWPVTSGHSMYIDATLDIGLVGSLTALVMVGTALKTLIDRYRYTRDPDDGLGIALLVFAFANGISESMYILPTLGAFIAGCSCVRATTEPYKTSVE